MDIRSNGYINSQSRAARILLSPILYHGYRVVIAGLFLYAGATKLADSAGFAESIAAYRLLPDPLVPCAAMGLPAVELLVGMGALINRRWAILGLAGIMVLFIGVLSYGVTMGLDIDCGCFDAEKEVKAAPVESAPMLGIPGLDDGGDGTIVQVEPLPGADEGEGTCTGESAGPSRLRIALIRDAFLFLGILYLVAWPDLRKRYGMEPSSNVQCLTSNDKQESNG